MKWGHQGRCLLCVHVLLHRGIVAGQGGRLEDFKSKPTDVRLRSWPCQNGFMDIGPAATTRVFQAAIAVIIGLTPTMFKTHVRL